MTLKQSTILIVDDDKDVLTAVRLLLKTEVKEIVTERNPDLLLTHLAEKSFEVVLLDMNFNSAVNTGNEGFFWLRRIKESGCKAAVIMITAYGDIDLAIRSLKEGAVDFVIKPWLNKKLLTTIQEAIYTKKGDKSSIVPAEQSFGGSILGQSRAMQEIFTKIQKVAPTEANVLILGENGTGKDLVANALHQQSLKANLPYVKVDMGSLTESLFESELFGYKKGAFTDAREDRIGWFEAANGGTIFLDEIGNISLQQQSKLLSVLQNRQVIRLGSQSPIPIHIRLLCATNVPLVELSNESRFRKDLMYRINTVEIVMPPLRHRTGDIPLLANHFVKTYGKKYFKPSLQLSDEALQKLDNYHFPGNVRELQYTIERAIIMCDTDVLFPKDILFSPIESSSAMQTEQAFTHLSTQEKNTIQKVIEKHQGNISKAAKELGLTRTALYRRLNKYEI